MKREVLSPLVVALGAAIAFAVCSADSPDGTGGSTDSSRHRPPTCRRTRRRPIPSPPNPPKTTDPDSTDPGTGPQGFTSGEAVLLRRLPGAARVHADRSLRTRDRVGLRWRVLLRRRRRGDGSGRRQRLRPLPGDALACRRTDGPTGRRGVAEASPRPTRKKSASTRVTSSRQTARRVRRLAGRSADRRSQTPRWRREPDVPDGSHQLLLDGTRLLIATQPYRVGRHHRVAVRRRRCVGPTLLHRSHLEGYLVATRAVDGARLVLTSAIDHRLPFVHPDQFGLDEDRALQQNKDIIMQSTRRGLDAACLRGISGRIVRRHRNHPRLLVRRRADDFAGLGSWIASIDLQGWEADRVCRHRVERRDRVRLDDQPLPGDRAVGLVRQTSARRDRPRRLARTRHRRP